MEWIKDYWYVILLGLVAVMFFLGHRTKKITGTAIDDGHQHGAHTDENAPKNGHGCCH